MAAADAHAAPLRVCHLCVSALGVSGAGVSVATAAGNRAFVCASGERAARIEDLQHTLGEGPCVDALERGTAVLVPDLDAPEDLAVERWPAFLPEAASLGVRALFALPLRVGAIIIGSMDLHRDRPGPLSRDQLASAWSAADAVATALLVSGAPAADPQLPLPGYDMQVHQATGMVQVQLGVSTRDALLALRARAFAEDRPLSAVASDVVARRLRFDPEATP